MKLIKLLSVILALGVLVLALAACGETQQPEVQPPVEEEVVVNPVEEENDIIDGMPNPIVEYDSVEDAVIAVGHLSELPETYARYNQKAQVISNSLIEIIYTNDSGEVLRIREEKRPSGDISGNYNVYAYNDTIEINGNQVKVSGVSEDSINLVTWNDGAYSHSIDYVDGHSMQEVKAVVSTIK